MVGTNYYPKFGITSVVGASERRPSNNLFALIGDSRPSADHANSTATNFYHNSNGIGFWVQNLTGGRVRFRKSESYAVGGATSEDVVNNQLASAVASPAANVLFLVSTNDQASNNWAASRSIAAISTAVASILSAGKFLYVIAELPRGSSVFTASRFTAQQQIDHDLVRAYLLALSGSRLTVIDAYPEVADLSGTPTDFIVAKTYDGVHQSISGAYSIASVIAPYVLQRHWPDSYQFDSADLYNASTNPLGSLVTNGQMAGTGGTGISGSLSGQLATSYSASSATFTGLTAVFSKVTTATGDWQQIVVAGNSGAGTPLLNVNQNLTFANLATGDALDGRGEFEVDDSTVGCNAIQFNVSRLLTGVTKGFSRSGANANGPWPTDAITGKWRLPSLLTLLGDENTVQLNVSIYPAPSTTGVSITMRFRNLDIRKT